ncbi:MAG: type II secretion system protein E [Parcubacteria group bacterium GW2011_GWC2_45_7]|nr:MAG: type II secretion system protein E [Parcubacteria group bacterium GW2011_GWC2_45_7]KKU73441.1 MAG: type II secretion system protein E [Parcubacteria group bacterium GW2011_GWA2_47_26]
MHELALQEKEKETERKAAFFGLPCINLRGFPISPEALQLVSEEQAKKLQAVCFFYSGSEFRLGTVDPALPEIKELVFQISERIAGQGAIYVISEESFRRAFALYEKLPKFRPTIKGVVITEEDLEKFSSELRSFQELQERLKGVSVTDVVTLLVAAALQSKSSDIHIEAEEVEIVVRFRIDGVLQIVSKLPKTDWAKVASRIKLLAGLKINIIDRPQDGRFTIFAAGEKTDVRVSTVPTAYGESIVMRLLRSTAVGLQFEDLGLRGRAYEQLKREVERPNGMIVTTGPTGSGKTTTLYAILNKLNDPETKIITLEDPIEYKLAGIAQSQIEASKDYTFAAGLRSILRQDPDVIMVGEIRDLETADITIQAALTGHLVLSTIHTNSAAGAIPRFLALGAKPFLLAPSLNAVIGQRLVRKIHEDCKEEIQLDEDTLKRVKEVLGAMPKDAEYKIDLGDMKFYRGRGCPKCFDLGYKGRMGIYEIMTMNKELEGVILSGKVSEYVMQEIAVKNGMITMAQDGLLKALDGITTVEEIFSVAE